MLVARSLPDLAAALASLPHRALVPTMGALHAGHLALLAAAVPQAAVVSIFVNPTQFGPEEDLSRYPRDEAADLNALETAGCAAAFLPCTTDIYPADDATTVEVGGPALRYEGARRPGHFRGVATVVTRLINLVQPSSILFGQKDWQQLVMIRRMVADLHLKLAVRDVPTVRDADGLALSSRNKFLSAAERAVAPALAQAGRHAAAAIRDGAPVAETLAAGTARLIEAGFAVDYFDLVDAASMLPAETLHRPARLIVAARLGSVRLLDNFAV